MARLEAEDAAERAAGVPTELRARQVAPTTGRFLFSLVAGQPGCEVLELGGSRGYSSLWFAAGVRILGGTVLSTELDPRKMRGLAHEHRGGGARRVRRSSWTATRSRPLARLEDTFDVVFIDAEKDDYERLFELARPRLEPGGLVVADNVLSHVGHARRVLARLARPTRTLVSVTVPLDRGLEVSTLLR